MISTVRLIPTRIIMTQSKKNKTSSKRKASARGPALAITPYGRPNQPRKGKVSNDTITAVCSNTDPFCVHSVGAKRFDADNARTVAWQARSYTTVTTNANGAACLEVNANIASTYRAAATRSGTPPQWNVWDAYASVDGYTDLDTNFAKYRVVSMGVRVFAITSPLASQGVVMGIASDRVSNIDAASSSYIEYVRIPLYGTDLHWVAKNQNENDNYKATDAALDNAHTHFFVCVDGGPASTAVLGVEITLNLELQAETLNAISNRLATAAYPHNTQIEMAVSNVYASTKSLANTTTEKFSAYLRNAALKQLRRIGSSTARAFHPLAGAAFDSITDSGPEWVN